MSAEQDLRQLEQLEGAREDLNEAILELVDLGLLATGSRPELSSVIFKLGSVRFLIEDAIRAHATGEPTEETGNG